jgi:hypothetical protein
MSRRLVFHGLAAAALALLGACATPPGTASADAAARAAPGPEPEQTAAAPTLAYIAQTAPPLAPLNADPVNAELQATLLSWAVSLSGLPAPAQPPQLRRMPHDYFVKNACNGRECKVLGWFPPGDTVYVDERLDPQNNLLAASIVVHEMVHYLQYRAAGQANGAGLEFSCKQSIALERQAYGAQREFITRYGSYRPVGASMHQVGCEPG